MTQKINTSGLGIGWDATCEVCAKTFRSYSIKSNVCSHECRFEFYSANRGDACWEWSGPKNTQGYGVLFLNVNKDNGRRKVVPAHRFSYTKFKGEIPEGMCLMHSCDNPGCVNPSHLSAGTWAQNNADRSTKGRSGKKTYSEAERLRYSEMFRGSGSWTAKLTEDQAREIKYCTSMGCMKLAKIYNISTSVVKSIRSGKSWKHV